MCTKLSVPHCKGIYVVIKNICHIWRSNCNCNHYNIWETISTKNALVVGNYNDYSLQVIVTTLLMILLSLYRVNLFQISLSLGMCTANWKEILTMHCFSLIGVRHKDGSVRLWLMFYDGITTVRIANYCYVQWCVHIYRCVVLCVFHR